MYRLLVIFLFLHMLYSCKTKTRFEQISSEHSGINFSNKINENDTFNVLDVVNIYNGGGVGIGDFNKDGLQDIYFAGNEVPNKLYLNKGDFKFNDVTQQAGVDGGGRWSRGISVVDINNDGWMDIYVCASLVSDSKRRENLLYINSGADKTGIPRFKNMAAEYGLNDTAHSTMAAFFDYDNDADLDMYLLINEVVKKEYPNTYRPVLKNREHPNTDKLFRNDWDEKMNHPVFTDVSTEAGITIEGYGHGVNIVDINNDGWKDIYVANDFLANNILYINNHNGTFTDEVRTYFKHTSENSMGLDIIDINNDGLADVIELDMNPEDNYRKKMMLSALGYQRYQNSAYFGYQHQYVRNVLQVNQGPRVLEKDSIGPPIFSDIGFYSGIAETDWSWTPSVIDFDNDGFRDIIITNGFPRDVTDHDFMSFRSKAYAIAAKREILEQIPEIKIPNYAYKNNGNFTFKNVTEEWGLSVPSFSNGAAYVDLDNDGDMDLVVNNINQEALVYKNNSYDKSSTSHFLQVELQGEGKNINGVGAFVEVYYDHDKKQVFENTPYRGYLSTVQNIAHFGLGKISVVDSVIVKWPEGKKQVLVNVKADQLLKVNIKNANSNFNFSKDGIAENILFTDITSSVNIHYISKDSDFVDFNIQKLLPHKFSEYGPGLATGDIDGNGLDDIISGGSFFFNEQVFLQQANGKFVQKTLVPGKSNQQDKRSEDRGILLFDADGDTDLDVYIASGGFEAEPNSKSYEDRLYVNKGKGNFYLDSTGLPQNYTSKSCVRSIDFDNDNDLDLFIAGRVEPWKYPSPVSSFIYRNDSKNGVIKFTDVTAVVAKSLNKIGLVCDALFTDFDNDGWQDLIVTGEWMPVTFLKNEKGIFKDISSTSGVNNKLGWWTSIVPGDLDNDGKIDYILGNLGLNSFYRASEKYPVKIYAKDFDNNGNYDAVPAIFLPTTQTDITRREFPAHTRDDMAKQMIMFKSKYQNYNSYATATFDKMFTAEELKEALVLQANYFENSYLKNMGNGKFEMIPLPGAAQYSCINGMVAEDFDGDGNLDILINGNDFGTEVSVGRYDACNGLFLKGNGKGGFVPLSIIQSGWFIPGDGKALVKLRSSNGKCLLAASQNKGPIKIFELKRNIQTIPFHPFEVSAIIQYKNGITQKREIGYGSSFLSQSGRFLNVDNNVTSVKIQDNKGNTRQIDIQ